MVAFFNKQLDINRFFVEDSEGKKGQDQEMPKVEFGGANQGAGESGFADTSDPFEDDLEEALCVFKQGDSNADILEKNQKLVMFKVDLENEQIVDATQNNQGLPDQDNSEQEAGDQQHPVLFNQYPLCEYHSLFLLFADAGLPQVLSDELLLLILQLFKVSDQSSLRVGYNSVGGDCITNNLHLVLVYADKLFGPLLKHKEESESYNGEAEVFPIELAPKRLFLKSTLQHRKEGEINMFNCTVRFGELDQSWPLKTLILSPDIDDENSNVSLEDAQEALAHAAGIVLNYLIEQNIPHNILIADEGMTLYIIPRKFDMLIEGVQFFTSFETLCGFIKFKSEAAYNSVTFESVYEQLANYVSLSDADFTRMKTELVEKFMKEYVGEEIH
jgi:hypothetical protein